MCACCNSNACMVVEILSISVKKTHTGRQPYVCAIMNGDFVIQISGKWLLGPVGCDFWLTADVLCCSASILHLLSVAVDR